MSHHPVFRHLARALPLAAVALLLGGLLSPLAAYTIYFKDGSKITSKEKYRIEGDIAHIVLLNGTETTYRASEIDVERTEKANQNNYGSALVIQGGEVREVPIEETVEEEGPTLRELVRRGEANQARLPQESAEDAADAAVPAAPVVTENGWIDLNSVPRRGYGNAELAGTLSEHFRARGVEAVQVWQGTRSGRPFVEVETGSEAAVFRALVVGASAVLQLGEQGSGVDTVELLMVTPEGQRAGQFQIDRPMAEALVTNRVIDPKEFFLRYVQF